MVAKKPLEMAAVQFCGRVGMWRENLDRMRTFVNRAHRKKAKLVLFPEGSLTGFVSGRKLILATAQSIPGPGSDAIQQMAQEIGVAVSVGISEQAGRKFYISQFTALPDGTTHLYRKRFGGETGFDRGEFVAPFSYEGYKIGIAICMDARIHELYRQYAYCGTDIFLKPNSAWDGPWKEDRAKDFEEKKAIHDKIMRLDWQKDCLFAATNGMAMLAANTVGDNGARFFPGGCWYGDGSGLVKKFFKIEYEKAKLREKILYAQTDPQILLAAQKAISYDLKMAKLSCPTVNGTSVLSR